MWKSWFSFRKKEPKQHDGSSKSDLRGKILKENNSLNETNGTPLPVACSRRNQLDQQVTQARKSPFSGKSTYLQDVSDLPSVSKVPSVMQSAGPLLSTPLLPKIKRAIEMNETKRYILCIELFMCQNVYFSFNKCLEALNTVDSVLHFGFVKLYFLTDLESLLVV